VTFLNPLYKAVAFLIVHIHGGLAHVVTNRGWSWALSIVFLTIAMRLVLFPIFVKQIKNQRAMQTLQPKMKELQAKYKNDKEKLNTEMMALWKENGANPLSGCLPLLLQIPIFISLFHTLRDIKPISGCAQTDLVTCYKGVPGFSRANVYSAAHAKLLGAPIAAKFTSSHAFLHSLHGSPGATKILCLVLTVIMGGTTFITQRQLMARNGPAATDQAAQTQKIMLYVFPLVFLFYGFKFPIGVLLYWLTTNVWSMVQQRVVINRMNPGPAAAGAPTGGGPELPPAGPLPGAKPKPAPRGPTPKSPPSGAALQLPPGGAIPATSPTNARPGGAQRPAGRSKNRKKGQR
jgi:YidC/Oxa1 family membrane protein insertase